MKRFAFVVFFILALSASMFAQATQGPTLPNAVPVVSPAERSDACNLVQHSHSTGATITLTAGTAGGPQGSIYICGIDIMNAQGTAVTAAAPTFITTTGINGSPQYMVASGPAAAGTASPVASFQFSAPLKSATSGTNVTFVLPSFITNQTISVNIYYRLGF